jgi:hypothetical protein
MESILFGDPFYHNIIYYLKLRDLYILKCVCKHYNTTISKTIIKNSTLIDIKNNFTKALKDDYLEFKNNLKMANYDKTHAINIENMTKDYNKYFVIIMNKFTGGPFDIYPHYGNNLKINGRMYHFQIQYYHVVKHSIYCVAIKSDADIKDIRDMIIKDNELQNTYWIEHDSSELFNFADYL